MSEAKHTKWFGIAWVKNGSECVGKFLTADRPITQKRALSEFKKAFPGLRDYTIQVDDSKPEEPKTT